MIAYHSWIECLRDYFVVLSLQKMVVRENFWDFISQDQDLNRNTKWDKNAIETTLFRGFQKTLHNFAHKVFKVA